MSTTQAAISREVRVYMALENIRQATMADRLGIKQVALSRRLKGTAPWTIENIDRLIDLGVSVRLPEPVGGEQR